jgi:isoamylase
MSSGVRIQRGDPLVLGMREVPGGFNFAVFSRHATQVTLLLFELAGADPIARIPLDADHHRTGDIWHARIGGDWRGKHYALRVDGPWAPEKGHRFSPQQDLVDPYADFVQLGEGLKPRAALAEHDFDWNDDRPPRHAWRDTVLYEAHV